jgi:hypothetical protein
VGYQQGRLSYSSQSGVFTSGFLSTAA